MIGESGSWGGRRSLFSAGGLVGVISVRAATVERLKLCDGGDGEEEGDIR